MVPFPVYYIEEAKSALQREIFDLILLDVNLPDGNGFDFTKEAISRYNTPFIFLTAYNLEEEIIKGLQLRGDCPKTQASENSAQIFYTKP